MKSYKLYIKSLHLKNVNGYVFDENNERCNLNLHTLWLKHKKKYLNGLTKFSQTKIMNSAIKIYIPKHKCKIM